MNVHWTESALRDLRAIEAYIGQHSPRYALSMVERIFDRTGVLATHPRQGAMVPERDEETLRELFEDPYRIVYRILEHQIDVVAVVHGARRFPRGI
ncbi:MAG: type II toxin-antitoxin system RelE/ParE family toxin [Gemmataceae bacterium]